MGNKIPEQDEVALDIIKKELRPIRLHITDRLVWGAIFLFSICNLIVSFLIFFH